MTDKTIKKDMNGDRIIYVYLRNSAMRPVFILSRTQKLKCVHDWRPVAMAGHGKWRRGCSKCGALSR